GTRSTSWTASAATSSAAAAGRSSARSASSRREFRQFSLDSGCPVRQLFHTIHRLIPGSSYCGKPTLIRLEAGKTGLEHRPPRWVEKPSVLATAPHTES